MTQPVARHEVVGEPQRDGAAGLHREQVGVVRDQAARTGGVHDEEVQQPAVVDGADEQDVDQPPPGHPGRFAGESVTSGDRPDVDQVGTGHRQAGPNPAAGKGLQPRRPLPFAGDPGHRHQRRQVLKPDECGRQASAGKGGDDVGDDRESGRSDPPELGRGGDAVEALVGQQVEMGGRHLVRPLHGHGRWKQDIVRDALGPRHPAEFVVHSDHCVNQSGQSVHI